MEAVRQGCSAAGIFFGWAGRGKAIRAGTALAVMIRPIDHGWAVCLTGGRVLVRYRGVFSKRLALRYLQRGF